MTYLLLGLYLLGVPVAACLVGRFSDSEAGYPPDADIKIGALAIVWPLTAVVLLFESVVKAIGRLGQACAKRKR